MDPILDIFNGEAFDIVTLTDAINKLPYVPGRAGRLGIFDEDGVTTTTVSLEEVAGTIQLVSNQLRGQAPLENTRDGRTMRSLAIPHMPLGDTIKADEIQNVRAFGAGGQLESVMSVVNQRMMRMNKSLDATVEYGRIGAIKGLILDADGSTTLFNLFTEFNVSQQTNDIALSNAATDIIGECTDTAGLVEDELGDATYEHIHAFCGKTFWKDFISHAGVKDAYRYYQATGQNVNPLRDDLRYAGFRFGGIVWEQYRGSVTGSGGTGVDFVPASEAYAFPVGVPGLFRTYYAPADYIETVNTMGLPRYAKQYIADLSGRGVRLETQTNPLSLCTRPRALVKITKS